MPSYKPSPILFYSIIQYHFQIISNLIYSMKQNHFRYVLGLSTGKVILPRVRWGHAVLNDGMQQDLTLVNVQLFSLQPAYESCEGRWSSTQAVLLLPRGGQPESVSRSNRPLLNQDRQRAVDDGNEQEPEPQILLQHRRPQCRLRDTEGLNSNIAAVSQNASLLELGWYRPDPRRTADSSLKCQFEWSHEGPGPSIRT